MKMWDTVSDMVNELERYAKEKGVDLKNNIPDDVNELDEIFNDGGEGRREHFVDLTWAYAKQFGETDDYKNENGYEAHVWKCITPALKRLQKKYGKRNEIEETEE